MNTTRAKVRSIALRTSFVVLILQGLSGTASAQSILDTAATPTPSNGMRLPFASASLQDDATALEVNPAGLAFMDTTEFGYGFELPSDDLKEVGNSAQSLFWAGGNQYVGGGLGVQFLEQPIGGEALDEYRKYTLGFALAAPRTFSIGVGLNWFGSDTNQRLDDLVAWDVGMQFRLGKHVALGAMLRDLNAPFLGEEDALPRRFDYSLAFRMLDGRIVLDNTLSQVSGTQVWSWTPRLFLEPLDGIRIFGNATFGVDERTTEGDINFESVWAGIELSLSGLGLAYAPVYERGSGNDVKFTGLTAYHWFSPNKTRGIADFGGRWVRIDLNAKTTESGQSVSFFGPDSRSFLELVKTLEDISRDETVDGVILVGGNSSMGYGQAWELRQAISKMKAGGKKTVAYMANTTLREYYVASAADQVWTYPTEPFDTGGVQVRAVSYRGVLNKLGVEAEFVRIGEYKSAPEALVRDEPSEANREQLSALVDALWREARSGIAAGRAKSDDEVQALLTSKSVLYPTEAMEKGLVDAVVYPDEFEDVLKDKFGAGISLEAGYDTPLPREARWGTPESIAVISIEGDIITGNSGSTPFMTGNVTGGETIRAICKSLENDSNVRAVVVRIDSPGGSAFASDQIYRALRKLSAKKPVIASMGNMAASGGYYAAAGADEIYATPNTITGSIGIFNGAFSASGLFDWLGVKSEAFGKGREQSGFFSPWTAEERARVIEEMEFRYSLFLNQAAQTRPLTADELDKVARGRVWMGQAALREKLVDKEGGLLDAIRRAEEVAGLPPGEALYKLYPSGSEFIGTGSGSMARFGEFFGLTPREDVEALKQLSVLRTVLGSVERTALLPLLYPSGEDLMLPYQAIEVR